MTTRDNSKAHEAPVAERQCAAALLVLFAGSGAVGLIYEVIWRRMLSLMLGGSIWATSMVLAAFMGGLALGAAVIGRRADRWENPLRAYAILEALIGLLGLAFLLCVPFLRDFYATIAALTGGSLALANLLRAPIALLVLLPPTFLMGATFPVLARHYLSARRGVGRGLGELYAVNTAGAVLGAALAGFVLIRVVGVRWTNFIAIAFSLAIAALAFIVSRRVHPCPVILDAPKSPRRTESPPRAPAIVGVALAVSGFTALAYEVLWTRVLVYLVGNSTYSFTVMLTAFLIGIAAGAGLFRFVERRLNYTLAAAAAQIAVAFIALSLIPLSDYLYRISQWLYGAAGPEHDAGFLLGRSYLLSFLILAPTTLLFGFSFPLLVRLFVGSEARLGRRVGIAYALNAIGATVGPLAAVFVLIRFLGIHGAIVSTAALNLLAGCALMLGIDGPHTARKAIACGAAAAVFLGLLLARREGIDVGRWLDGNRSRRGEELFYHEGVSATVSVFHDPRGGRKVLLTDGISQVPTDLDSMQVFKLLGHLPFLVRPQTQSVLVTAFGGGITAGAVLTHPVERVDVVEICSGVLDASDKFLEENRRARYDPRLRVILTDANEYVRWAGSKYGAIVSDSTHPAAAESWVLYTRDFYRACRDRLEPGGVMCQWLPIHRLATEDLKTILRTFQSVFPHTTLWFARGYTVLLATGRPLKLDVKSIDALLADHPEIAADLASVHLDSPEAILKNLILDEQAVAALAGEVPVASENHSPLEFASQRSFGWQTGPANIAAIRQALTPSLEHLVSTTSSAIDLEPVNRVRGDYLDAVQSVKDERPQEALPFLLRAAETLPDDRDIRVYLRWAGEESAKTWLAAGQLETREPPLRDLTARCPDSAFLQMAWGLSLIETARKSPDPQRVQQGIALLQQSVAMAPDDPAILDIVGQACLSMEAFPIAAKLLERLSRLQPGNPAVLCNLARAHIGLGRLDDARAALQQTLAADPNHPAAHSLLRSLEPAERPSSPSR